MLFLYQLNTKLFFLRFHKLVVLVLLQALHAASDLELELAEHLSKDLIYTCRLWIAFLLLDKQLDLFLLSLLLLFLFDFFNLIIF
jgi:hypothetical protein